MTLSVVLASCRSASLVGDAITSLKAQCQAAGAELIVARRAPDGAEDPVGLFDGCGLVTCPSEATIPMLRGAGIAAATGEWVLVTEDNCIARADWIARYHASFAPGVAVVGGTMANAHPDHAIDDGAFFVEYGFFGQARREPGAGASPFVTGANVAYHRSVATDVATWALAGDWEGEIHHRLAARGVRFALARDAVVEQNVHCTLGAFCIDRYEHANGFAKTRSTGWSTPRRVVAACATPLLPVVFTWRAWQNAGRLHPGGFLKALPYTLVFSTAWAAGEAAGYLRGAAR